MQKIEEYILLRKKKDKLNEFDFTHHSENMGKIIQYVSDYFNNYLTPEDFSNEKLKLQQNLEKSKKMLLQRYPNSHEFIENYYLKNQKRIDSFIGKSYESFMDVNLYYRDEDFLKIAEDVIFKKLLLEKISKDDLSQVVIAVKDYHNYTQSKPRRAEMKELDNNVVKWVMDSYREYGVNIADYAFNLAWKWGDKYVENKYVREEREMYYINKYDYRYQENPFDIDHEFEKHQDLPFMEGKRDFLEMLVMYFWLFSILEDQSYWPEYEQLCINNRQMPLKTQKRILIPVTVNQISYSEIIDSQVEYLESKNGLIKSKAKDRYILSIINEKQVDNIWTNQSSRKKCLDNLKSTFSEFGLPDFLELRTPIKTPFLTIKELIAIYQEIAIELKEYKKLTIAIKTSSIKTGKEPLIHNMNDIMKLHNAIKEMQLKLKIIIDLVDTSGRNVLKKQMDALINTLAGTPDLFIGFHLNAIDSWGGFHGLYYSSKRSHLYERNPYPPFSEFMTGIATILQDSKPRFFIPQKITKSKDLEILTDQLYRCGCTFK